MALTQSQRGQHQILVLEHVARHPGCTATQVAREAGLPRLLVHQALQHLLKAQLVHMERRGARVTYEIRTASR